MIHQTSPFTYHLSICVYLSYSIADNEYAFIKGGVYLIIEKLKMIVYKNLLRKVYLKYNKVETPQRENILQHNVVLAALRLQNENMDIDELECIIANLIYNKKVKGYIARGKCLVLSKSDPFAA